MKSFFNGWLKCSESLLSKLRFGSDQPDFWSTAYSKIIRTSQTTQIRLEYSLSRGSLRLFWTCFCVILLGFLFCAVFLMSSSIRTHQNSQNWTPSIQHTFQRSKCSIFRLPALRVYTLYSLFSCILLYASVCVCLCDMLIRFPYKLPCQCMKWIDISHRK